MDFVSYQFYFFLIILVAVYYIIPLKYRWYVLLLGSLVFYWLLSGSSVLAFSCLIAEAGISYAAGRIMEKMEKNRKPILVLSILFVTIPLLATKVFLPLVVSETFLPFMSEKVFLPLFGKVPENGVPAWLVPIGISFFSMQLIAYVSDVYMGRIKAEKNILKFLLFVSFFPQIIQGPIPRYAQLAPQLTEGHRLDERGFVKGFMLILWGFVLKLCIADKAGIAVDTVFNNFPQYGGVYVLVAGILYSFQLYADFMACTSFARGIAGLFGIELIDNFMRPYFATSVKDFWRRWHISLSSWLRDYIYIPLGGNRKGKFRKYFNILITFLVSGIWHGAGLRFIVWGLLHGIYQIIGELLTPVKERIDKILKVEKYPLFGRICHMAVTYVLVTVGWVIFRAKDLTTGIGMLKSIFTVYNPWVLTDDSLLRLGLDWKEIVILFFCLIVMLNVGIAHEKGLQIREKILTFNLPVRWCLYIGTILFVIIFGSYGFGFNSQDFIYGGF